MGLNYPKEIPRLTEKELQKLSHLTGYPIHKVQSWYNSFIIDCPDGILTRKKFKHFYKQFYPHGKPNKFSNRLFEIFDRNKDNKIDFAEFLHALNTTIDGNIEKKLECAFQMYDLDDDGVLDRYEVTKALRNIYELLGEDHTLAKYNNHIEKKVNEIFEKFDSNGDGYLTLNEFTIGCLKNDNLRQMLNTGTLSDTNTISEDLNSSICSSVSSSPTMSIRSTSSNSSISCVSTANSDISQRTNVSVISNTNDVNKLSLEDKLMTIILPQGNFPQRLI